MRVLLDENLDWRLVHYFDADFQVTTVSQQGWKGMRNGELLRQAAKLLTHLSQWTKALNINRTSANTPLASFSSLPKAIGFKTFNPLWTASMKS